MLKSSMRVWGVLAVVMMAACAGDDPETPVDGISTTEGGGTVIIGDEWRSCSQDSDCVLVDTSCDGCCQQDAIASNQQDAYGPASADACDGYEGGECDCCFLVLEAACSDAGVCQAVTPDGEDPNACI